MAGELAPSVQRNEQSNTSVSYGDRFMLKFIRRVESGTHPQIEIEELLATSPVSGNIPELLGTAFYKRGTGKATSAVAILESHIQHQSDGWLLAVDELTRFLEGVASAVTEPPSLGPGFHPMEMPDPDPLLVEKTGPWFELVSTLGRRTAQLHTALATSATPTLRPNLTHRSISEPSHRASGCRRGSQSGCCGQI